MQPWLFQWMDEWMIGLCGDRVREWEHTLYDWIETIFVTRNTKTIEHKVNYGVLHLIHNKRFSLTVEYATNNYYTVWLI